MRRFGHCDMALVQVVRERAAELEVALHQDREAAAVARSGAASTRLSPARRSRASSPTTSWSPDLKRSRISLWTWPESVSASRRPATKRSGSRAASSGSTLGPPSRGQVEIDESSVDLHDAVAQAGRDPELIALGGQRDRREVQVADRITEQPAQGPQGRDHDRAGERQGQRQAGWLSSRASGGRWSHRARVGR